MKTLKAGKKVVTAPCIDVGTATRAEWAAWAVGSTRTVFTKFAGKNC
jgi:hypothetical protein